MIEKYGGQLVEVTGEASYFWPKDNPDAFGEVLLHAGGTQLTNVVTFRIGTKEDLDKIKFSGEIVTLRATIPKKGEKDMPVWSVTKVTKK